MKYTSLQECTDLVLELLSLTAEPADLQALLKASAAAEPATTYRPYWVAAFYLATRPGIVSAEGAVFRDLDRRAAAYMGIQRSLDVSLTVPSGYEASMQAIRGMGQGPAYVEVIPVF